MSHAPLPPGPGPTLSLDAIRAEPLAFLSDLRARHGDIVHYGSEGWAAILLTHPDHVRHVLVDNVRNYRKEGTPDLRMLKPMLGDGLLTSDGEVWRAQRHLLAPLFRRNMVERFGPLIADAAVAQRNAWAERVGAPIEVCGELSELTLRIVASALFSHDADDDAGRFGAAVEILNEAMGGLEPAGAASGFRFAGALAVIHDLVESAMRDHRQSPGAALDALSLMLAARAADGTPAMSDQQLLDQSVTLLLAGHETTAKALTWTLHMLAEHEEVAARMYDEIDTVLGGRPATVADLPALPWCAAVLAESMRLYTPIWIVSRIAIDDDEIGGYHIAAGTLVPISPWLVHRHEDYWPDPERFDPTRFMPPAPAAHHPCQFLPFGAGVRHCIGRHFALIEMQLVLATLLQGWRMQPVAGAPVVAEALVTLRPRGGLWMTMEARHG